MPVVYGVCFDLGSRGATDDDLNYSPTTGIIPGPGLKAMP